MAKTIICANEYFQRLFGQRVYKLALDGGMTCPNRDGTCGSEGCIFCLEGSGSFAEPFCGDVALQIERAKRRVSAKMKNGKYIAYFQSYTNTYADTDYLKSLFLPAAAHPDIVALSIGTRPDCLPDDVLRLLSDIRKIKPVFVELGLQTVHPATAAYIRRGYDLEIYDRAVSRLHEIGVNVVTHVILGLPFEDRRMMLDTVKYAGGSADGVKLQLLHVLRGTELAKRYARGEFETMTLEQYVGVLCDGIEALPEHCVIHRMTGDAPRAELIAPAWSADKKRVLGAVNSELAKRGIVRAGSAENAAF